MKRTRGRAWQAIRRAVLMADPLCRTCKAKGITKLAEQVDHIKPLHKGGTDERSNLCGLCLQCHQDKTANDMGYKEKPKIGIDGWPQ